MYSVYYNSMLKLKQKAPAFKLLDQNGNTVSLKDFLGKKVLLYFYPKDDTPGCTKEACGFQDNYKALQKAGLVILGMSPDSVKSHKKFADKYKLTFPLLSDESKTTLEKYGVWQKKKFMGREYIGVVRTSFLIDEKGKIQKMFENVNPEKHPKEVVTEIK